LVDRKEDHKFLTEENTISFAGENCYSPAKRHPVIHLGRGATRRMLAIACCSAGAHARVNATPATPIALAAAPPPATPPAPAAVPPQPPLFLAHRLNRAPPLLVPDRPQPPNRCNSCVDSLLDGFLVLTNASGTFLAALLALRQHDTELHAAVRRRDTAKLASQVGKELEQLAAADALDNQADAPRTPAPRPGAATARPGCHPQVCPPL